MLPLIHCLSVYLGASSLAAATAEVPVPSNYQNNVIDGKSSTPPAGPLPDPVDMVDGSCSNDDTGLDGACTSSQSAESTIANNGDHPSKTTLPSSSSSSSSSSSPPSSSSTLEAIPTGKTYCPGEMDINEKHSTYGNMWCFVDDPPAVTTSNNTHNSFASPHNLKPGEVAPIVWRNTGKIVTQYAFQVGLPPQLISSLLTYCEELGMIDAFRKYTSTNPIPPKQKGHNGQFVTLSDSSQGHEWYAQRPEKKWESDMHWISPANEKTHEAYLKVLGQGGFDQVLEAIATSLTLDSLVAYHLTFIAVSHSERGFRHYDAMDTHGGVYNVIIPLLVEDDDTPELILWDDDDEDDMRGGYKYKIGVGAMMGDDAMHGTHECDYRNLTTAKHGGYVEDDSVKGGKRKIGMRLAATVYIAELYPENVPTVAKETLTQIFPLRDERWLLAQEARHYQSPNVTGYEAINSTMLNDRGRLAFRTDDELDDCEKRAEEGKCTSDVEETRKKCAFSCKVYIEEGPTRIEYDADEKFEVNVCTQNRTGDELCKTYQDDSSLPGEFINPLLEPGELFPMIWRDDKKCSTDYAYQIGLPPELTTTLLEYCDDLGITDAMRELTGDAPLPIDPDGGSTHGFYDVEENGEEWYVQRPPAKWTSNMHWISPSNEKTHEEYLEVLGLGNFDVVLQAIGKYLGLESLAVYHLTFIGVSYSEKGFMHRDTHNTGGSVYNVIIPLILEEDSPPELVMSDDDDEKRKGRLKYKVGTAAMMGDDAMHGTEACDYRENGGMRLAATVYIADINERNAKKIAKQTLTQIFPLPDKEWLMAQSGRHWKAPSLPMVDENDMVEDEDENSLVNDPGRQPFTFKDKLSDCYGRAELGMCTSDTQYTRIKCLRSCEMYEVYWDVEEAEIVSPKEEFEFLFEEYVEGERIDQFFSDLEENNEDEPCVDESDDCAKKAEDGLCLTDPDMMEEESGCYRSCLYCLTKSSRELFSLGVRQVVEVPADDEDSEDAPPSHSDVVEVMARMEHYFVTEVLVYEDLSAYRLPCRNTKKECAYWAAKGSCESTPGYMGKHCPAACRNCPMSDLSVRCPIDESKNVFQPGDINAMFERWFEEAGQDTSKFSSENLPTGGRHPDVGEMTVISSPYHDFSKLLDEDESEEDSPPLPWIVSIEDFLTHDECDKLIQLGTKRGYERSTSYDKGTYADGSARFKESDERTSWNTFCQGKCKNHPTTQGIIRKMTKLTGIPYDNYESLQLVRYNSGQYYEQHHDSSPIHNKYPYGPRILTIFLYLNDVEDGTGGTKFEDLQFTATPKRGTALVWPSVTDDLEDKEEWTWHEALPVGEGGVKYGANAWIHLRDYQNSPDYC